MNSLIGKGRNCAVVLERLDAEILSQYMQTYDPNPTLLNFINNVTDQSKRCKFCFNDYSTSNKYSKPRKKRKLMKSVSNNRCKRKRRRIRLFISSDDESSNESNEQQSLNKKIMFKDKRNCNSPSTSFGRGYDVPQDRAEPMEVTAESQRRVNVSNDLSDEKYKKMVESSKPRAECKEKIFENLLVSNKQSKSKNIENKVIQEVIKLTKIIIEKEQNRNTTEMSDVEGDECQTREDNEDDTATVIFEDLPELDTGDTVEKKTGDTDKKNVEFKNSKNNDMEKQNSKNPTESLNENSTAVSPPRESSPGGGLEKSAQDKNTREHLLGEMCYIVKRLHELLKIILQLQREVPRDEEFAVHFSKVIFVQRENFYNEIKKNQKVILENYQKLLPMHDNSEYKVESEIAQRTCLNIEDVKYIISQCLAFEKKEKTNSAFTERQEKQSRCLQPKTSVNWRKPYEKSQKLVKAHDHLRAQSLPFFPPKDVNYKPRLTSTPVDITYTNTECPARESTVKQTQTSSYNSPSAVLPFSDGYQGQNSNRTYLWTQQIYQNQAMDLGLKLAPQQNPRLLPGVSLRPDPAPPNRQSSKAKIPNPHPQNMKSATSSFLLNSDCLPNQRSLNPGCLASGIPRHLLCVQPYGTPSYNVYQSLPSVVGSTNFGSSLPPNTLTYVNVQQPNNPPRGNVPFSSNIHNRMVDAPRQTQSSVAIPRYFNYFDDSVRFSSSYFAQTPHAFSISGEESQGRNRTASMKSGTEHGKPSSGATQEVLDPTVPQILTYKNYRLQAEPKLRQGPDEDVDSNSTKVFREPKGCSRGVKKNTKTRVYVCARSGCKKSGVHICQGCESVIYCSEFCQLSHWGSKHKTECHQLKELKGI